MNNNKKGYLEIIFGCMYAGKTSRLIEIYNQHVFCNIPICAINHAFDIRYSETQLVTHDKKEIPCIRTTYLMDEQILAKINSVDVILINEGQFFTDLIVFVKLMLSKNKQIYICGLDGDSERNKFGQLLDIVPLCDKVYKLTSLCSICRNGTVGIFSKRLSSEREQIVVGSSNYIPVCRDCYLS